MIVFTIFRLNRNRKRCDNVDDLKIKNGSGIENGQDRGEGMRLAMALDHAIARNELDDMTGVHAGGCL